MLKGIPNTSAHVAFYVIMMNIVHTADAPCRLTSITRGAWQHETANASSRAKQQSKRPQEAQHVAAPRCAPPVLLRAPLPLGPPAG